jgi:hypothetical protein
MGMPMLSSAKVKLRIIGLGTAFALIIPVVLECNSVCNKNVHRPTGYRFGS